MLKPTRKVAQSNRKSTAQMKHPKERERHACVTSNPREWYVCVCLSPNSFHSARPGPVEDLLQHPARRGTVGVLPATSTRAPLPAMPSLPLSVYTLHGPHAKLHEERGALTTMRSPAMSAYRYAVFHSPPSLNISAETTPRMPPPEMLNCTCTCCLPVESS